MTTQPSDRCRTLLEQLSRYIDGDLTPVERRSMSAHLRRCPCCQTIRRTALAMSSSSTAFARFDLQICSWLSA